MIERKRNGQIFLDGERVDMYELSRWIMRYNRVNQSQLTPRKIKKEHIIMFREGVYNA